MTDYRIYLLDSTGRIVSGYDAVRDSDEAACAHASSLLALGAQAEVWVGSRWVGRVFEPSPAPPGNKRARLYRRAA